ncbi:MAG: pilus assembly protein N-terminal domain-containing protein [Proteobacteria bacterium]|nr:pilus assembly protein N-terminal domain-containing protein [Pseudomonadota bacterium]
MNHFYYCTRIEKLLDLSKKAAISLSCLLFFTTALAGETIYVSPGRQQSLSIPNVMRASISDQNIAAAETISSDNQVIVTGLSIGKTDMVLWMGNGKKDFYIIHVGEKQVNVDKELQGLLSGVEGIRVKNTASGVVLDGQLYRSEDLDLVQKVLKQYPQVQNYTKVNHGALEFFQQVMLEKLRAQGFDQIQISNASDTLYLEGFVSTPLEKTRAEKIAKTVYIKTENHLEMGISKKNLILVDVKFMEILKNSLHNLGIQWPQKMDVASNLALNNQGFTTVLSSQSTVQLNALIDKGDAKVLSNPKLLCQSGFPASFDAGGEIPIRLMSERTADVFFKSYGLHLDVSAKSDSGKRASIEIQSRISTLDMATAIDGIPGILEHKVNTAVNLEMGQTVALAGLIESKNSKNVTKVPVLGHIPVLGELFKSRNFRNSLSEFVVFLTPILANGEDSYHMHQKNAVDQQWVQTDKKLKYKVMD